MMKGRARSFSILLFAWATSVACTSGNPAHLPDGGPDEDATDGGAGDLSRLEPGLFGGELRNESGAVGARLALWNRDETAFAGRLTVGDEETLRAYRVELDASAASFVPVEGLCESCVRSDGWSVALDGHVLRLTQASDAASIDGFHDLVMEPSDGFKPETVPGEHVDFYRGVILAVEPRVESEPALDAECSLTIDSDQMVQEFVCSEGAREVTVWSSPLQESLRRNGDEMAFTLDVSGIRITLVGRRVGSMETRDARVEGLVVSHAEGQNPDILDAVEPDEVIGYFTFHVIVEQ